MNKLQFIQWLRKINLTKELVADTYHDKYLSLYLAKKIADEVWSIKIEKGRERDKMNIDKQVREVLEKMVYADIEVDKHFLIDTIIDQTLSKIHALYMAEFERILPKETKCYVVHIPPKRTQGDTWWCRECERINARNELLAEIKSKMKEVQNGKILCIT